MPTELLLTIGEIAVAFAGFAGLVVALSRRSDRPAGQIRLDVQHLKNILAQSLFAVAFSLLPVMLVSMGLAEGASWRGSSAVFAVIYGPYLGYMVPRNLAAYRESGQRLPTLYRLNIALGASMVIVLALCGAGVAPTSAYLPVLGFCLFGAGTSFVRVFLSVARGGAAV